jgi:rod shape determining protein RodA
MFWVFAMAPLYLAIIINLRYLLKFSYVIYTLSLIGLVAVFTIGDVSMGARRWIDLGFMKVQPSEFAKIGVVFAIARYYHFVKSFSSHKMIYAIGGFGFAIFPAFLTILQPDLGSGLVIASLACLMVFVNGIRWRWLLIAITGLMITLPFAWNQMHDYQKDRIFTFLDPEKDPKGAGYNVIQSKIAIGSGGFFGKGYLNNDQSALKFLPENQTDFAFTVFAEEFGFFGCVLFVSCNFSAFYSYMRKSFNDYGAFARCWNSTSVCFLRRFFVVVVCFLPWNFN